jgi:hypothetical protein
MAAAWLVLVFSLLSKKSEVVDGLAVTIKPLFGAPVSHACTWPVIGIETYVLATETEIGPATDCPTPTPEVPVTADSLQEPVGTFTLIDPAAPTLLT